jgi:Raf kinase inhibitor-like YbhB/YbcL family protein
MDSRIASGAGKNEAVDARFGLIDYKSRMPTDPQGCHSMSLILTSPAFLDRKAIPTRHTGDGEDLSPPLQWSALPKGTVELAIIVDDPDAPSEDPWVHWLLYNLPLASAPNGLAEGIDTAASPAKLPQSAQGLNSWGTTGYRGPAPPPGHGRHHYHIKVYALDSPLALPPGLDKHTLMNEMSGHILGHGELVGTYERPSAG